MGAVNFITTIVAMRAPGMTMWRMSVFTWATLITSILIIMIFPPLASALFALGMDRRFGGHIFDPENGERCSGSTCSGSSGTLRCMCLRYLSLV